jgi:manganese/iron transport system permease protein
MRNALAIGFFLGILSAVAGSYLIVQQMSMMAGEIAHAVLPGISLAYYFNFHLFFSAFISGLISALLVGIISKRSRIKVDSAMALTLTSFLGIGVLFIEILRTKKIDLSNILFGDILEISTRDVWQTALITILILLLDRVFYKELLLYTFNPQAAQAYGFPINIIYFSLLATITVIVVVSIQTVGVLLVTALLIGPAITAYLIVKELYQMMILGSLIGIFCNWIGMYLSYYLDIPSGATIVLVIIIIFLSTLVISNNQNNSKIQYFLSRKTRQ